MILTFRPIKVPPSSWKAASASRPVDPFRVTYRQNLGDLDVELRKIRARDVFLQVDASEDDIRLDGQLRANAMVTHPGVILTVDSASVGTLVLATDRYANWHGNLRAVTLGLGKLRDLERYGIADQGQQYAGYRELGAGMPLGPGEVATMSVDTARRLLMDGSQFMLPVNPTPGEIESFYRSAVKRHHPDVGGDAETFRLITEARDVLITEARDVLAGGS